MSICDRPGAQTLPADALTAPSVADLAEMSMRLQPVGPAWGSPDGEMPAMTGKRPSLWTAIASGLADLYARLTEVLHAAGPESEYIAIDEWEAELGLPNACLSAPEDDAARRQVIIAMRRWRGVITEADYYCLAGQLGYDMVILDHFDGMRIGDPVGNAMLGRPSDEFVVTFAVGTETSPRRFAVGTDPVGNARLTDFEDASDFECWVGRVLPAEMVAVFAYGPDFDGATFLIEGSRVLGDGGEMLTEPA